MIGFLLRPWQSLAWVRRRLPSHATDHGDLDRIARGMLADYRAAVADGAPRGLLAEILTGLAGCELAMARTNPAMGWECTVGESARRSGLLLLEVAAAVGGGPGWDPAGGEFWMRVRAGEFGVGPVADALDGVAATAVESTHAAGLGAAYDELWHAVVAVVGGQAAEVLVALMRAHGHDPRACRCAAHGRAAGGERP
ncbi:MAG: hypothetical protein ACRDT0_17510 [Pseudonocardiaceae bacterium]